MSILQKLLQLGVTEGITFRCMIEDGVGPIIVPNPAPNRMQVNAVPRPPRPVYRRRSGRWTPKALHVAW